MSECMCDRFGLVEDNSDSFETWMGLRGPAGPAGSGVKLRGPVETSGDLPASAEPDEMWLVGAAAPYTGYFWNGSSWVSAGQLAVGPVGPSPSFSVGTVSTLPAGSDAEVTITGTDEEPVLNFGLPRGATGATGADGPQGPAGPGVPDGGSAGQILAKASGANQDTEWVNNIAAATATPLMDGTGAVGSSAKYAKEDHVHPHDSLICRKNLLDNWYFVGGGSQLGYGTFPINQRGQASYSSNNAYGFDRWKLRFDSGGSCALGSGGVTISGGSSTQAMAQTYPNGGKDLRGKTVTFSALFTSVTGEISLTIGNSTTPLYTGTSLGYVNVTEAGVAKLTVTIPSTLANDYLNFVIGGGNGTAFTVTAVKLELGDTQTLVYQENNTWVLNEIPDYSEQLYRCLDSHADSGDTYANKGLGDYLNNVPFKVVIVSASHPSIHVGNGCRAFISCADSTAENNGIYNIWANGSGVAGTVKFSSSGPAVTAGQNQLTFTVGATNTFNLMIFAQTFETLNNIYLI